MEALQTHDSRLIDIILQLSSAGFLADTRASVRKAGVIDAVVEHDNAAIFDWLTSLLPLQGISDAAAFAFDKEHGGITWADVGTGLHTNGQCPRLRSWWHFECGYRKSAQTCAKPALLGGCALPRRNLRKGALNQAAYGTYLFFRDVCDGDLVAWIDERLAQADKSNDPIERGRQMMASVVQPLTRIPGTGRKLWSMILADMLLAGDPNRERWVAAGASMIAVDSLVHNYLHRTGILREHNAKHPYGPRCYQPGGCADIIERIARGIDARIYNPTYPPHFPRFIQHAIWFFCAESGWNICNGRQIDDHFPCRQVFCPAGPGCARLPLNIV